MISVISTSRAQTFALGNNLAKLLKGGEVLALTGPLGSGKTAFVQGLAKGLGVKNPVTSPSFVIFNKYPLRHQSAGSLYHFDLYRLRRPRELLHLGFAEILTDPQNICAIEWAEKADRLMPKRTISISFIHGQKPESRIIKVNV